MKTPVPRRPGGPLVDAAVVAGCLVAAVLLDAAVGTGWMLRLDPASLTRVVASYPALALVSGGYTVVRTLPLLLVASRLAGRGVPSLSRIGGVWWSELVLRGLPIMAVLVWCGFVGEDAAYGSLDAAGFVLLWLAVGAGADAPLVARSGRWGAYATAEPARYVLARVARVAPVAMGKAAWARAVGLLCSGWAGGVRLTLAMFAGGLTGPPPSTAWWWTALTVASVLDVVAVAASVADWRGEGESPRAPNEPN